MHSSPVLSSLLLTCLIAPAISVAQVVAPPPEPYRPQRILAIGNVAFLGQWEPLTTVGGLWQISFEKTRIERDELGATLIIPPHWYLHTLLSGGVAFDPAESSKSVAPTAYGQLGFVRRIDSPVTALGPTISMSSTPRSIGGAFRFEVMDNLGLQVGWTNIKGVRGPRFMVSVDFFRRLWGDIGLAETCYRRC